MATYLDEEGLTKVWSLISSNFARGDLAIYFKESQPKESDIEHKPALVVLKNGSVQLFTD